MSLVVQTTPAFLNALIDAQAPAPHRYYNLYVGWKPILYWLFGPKNQSFRNKSGKTQTIRIKFGIRGHVKGWQRSGNFGRDRPILAKMGAGTSPAERELFSFSKPSDLSATSQRPIFTKFGRETYFDRCPVAESGNTFSKIVTLAL